MYGGNDYVTLEAEDAKDCIIQFARFTGECAELFLKALRGCQTVDDNIAMYEIFGIYRIDGVFAIAETLYQGGHPDVSSKID